MYSVHNCTKFSTCTGTCRGVDLVWCSKLESTGASLENFPHKILWYNMVKQLFWTLDRESCELQAENFQKTLWKLRNRHVWLFLGDFVWGFYGGVLMRKCRPLVRDWDSVWLLG